MSSQKAALEKKAQKGGKGGKDIIDFLKEILPNVFRFCFFFF